VSLLGISDAAESIGFATLAVRLTWEKLKTEAPKPCIVHWKQNHFIVVEKIVGDKVYVADPAIGKIRYNLDEFKKGWISSVQDGEGVGVCLLLQPTPAFYQKEGDPTTQKSIRFLFKYFRPHRRYLVQLISGMVAGSAILLILPFLTQAIVDVGIGMQDIGFVYLILIAQLVLIAGRTSIEFIRSWILLHISTRINVSLISDYLIKLMRLPFSFFDTKMTGDILQRIGDHSRIETFLTQSTLNILFSIFNLLIFGIVLAVYKPLILLVFLTGSLMYVGWILMFLKKRRELDNRRFQHLTENQNSIIQIVSGMQEIKMNNSEHQKRWDWENIQAKIFRIRVKSLSLVQYQQVGSVVINEIKNLLITFLAAKAVIDGQMTLGVMFAVQYIVGQMNGPVEQLIGFFHSTQDAKISIERLSEVHNTKPEGESEEVIYREIPENVSLQAENLTFQYEGPRSPKVVDNLSFDIPSGKVTAIVGPSGSGKTTLMKLLLGLYQPVSGGVLLDGKPLTHFSPRTYRENCGVVLQDGYLFADTIAKNIALGAETIDIHRLAAAAQMANISDFIESFPSRFNSMVGIDGQGLSQGQKQRILIARAIYKDPRLIFFDEATNSLDASNEKVIMENLAEFFKGRTVVVIAHRLSTVKNADQILVMEKGTIVETGNHESLIKAKGAYFNLVKNQLELGL
jgi:ATP-binding cassette subfamily B protein